MKKKKTPATSTVRLLPVMDPKFNAREMVKQSCMLEDHLNSPQKRCCDCIKKHFLTLEGLAEEAPSLECAKYTCPGILKTCGATVRSLHQAFEHTPAHERKHVFPILAARLRQLRKKLMRDDGVKIDLHKLPKDERDAVLAIRSEAAGKAGGTPKRKKKTVVKSITTKAASSTPRRRRVTRAGSRR